MIPLILRVPIIIETTNGMLVERGYEEIMRSYFLMDIEFRFDKMSELDGWW